MSRTVATTPRAASPSVGTVPRWLPIVTTALSVLGLGVAAYLTFEHYTGNSTLSCSENGLINCLKVTTSPESRIVGIPVAVLGLAFFAGILPLQLPVAWRAGRPWAQLRLAGLVVGVGMVAYLVYTELVTIDAVCLWCTAVHVITILLFAVTVVGTALVGGFERTAARR